MLNTQGFKIVAELPESSLLTILQAAWKSGGDASGEGVIPEYLDIPTGTPIGPYQVKDGFVQIPQANISIELNPTINGLNITLGTIIHIEIDNPPVESATFFDIEADIRIVSPFGNPEANSNLALILEGLPPNAITVTITNGNPLDSVLDNAVEEYVHQLFKDNGAAFPHLIEDIPISIPPFGMNASIQLFDDESDPNKQITISNPAADKIRLNIPCYIRFYEIMGNFFGFELASPMGIMAEMQITADYIRQENKIAAFLSTADVALININPAPGVEGDNYNTNKGLIDLARNFDPTIPQLEDAIVAGFQTAAEPFVGNLPDINIDLPTLAEMEAALASEVRTEMEARKYIMVWQPESDGGEFNVDNVVAKVLPTVLAIAVNGNDSANEDALVDFVPAGCGFAIGLDGEFINDSLQSQLDEKFPNLPTRLPEEDTQGEKIDLRSLDAFLIDHCLRVKGSLTVVDAILGSIDIDASFTADFDLEWVEGPDGGQTIQPSLKEDPDVDIELGFLSFLLVFLFGFLTFGLGGGIIAIIALLIVEAIAESVGGGLFKDAISNQVTGIDAFPNVLDNIGNVDSFFKNPIDIFATGLIIRGDFNVTSFFIATTIDFANTSGPYFFAAGNPINFNGGLSLPESTTLWDFGDGNSSINRNPAHNYGDSGLYISKLQVKVNQEGGATTRHFTKVKLKNVPPVVSLPPNITVNEGEEFEIIGSFTDKEWLDKHTARFDFGDNSKPQQGEVSETNNAPQAVGTAKAKHAYCDNGSYTLRLMVEDDDGGIGETTMNVIVNNVPPVVKAPEKLCVLVGQQVVLKATFTDKGWCDTHTAVWDFGDCHKGSGVIEMTNESPEAKGKVEACHVYHCCGTYQSKVTVTDDDGGIGEAITIIKVVELKNAHLEDGFRFINISGKELEKVANEWCPYEARYPSLDSDALGAPMEANFDADTITVRDGQRAQRVSFRGTIQAGIYQQICANKGWCYEFNAFYHLPGKVRGKARIGIDPSGGTNPSSPKIVWVEGDFGKDWMPLAVKAEATADTITLFMGGVNRHRGDNIIFWDKTHLCMIQPICKNEKEEESCKKTCITFEELPQSTFTTPFTYKQLLITPLDKKVFATTIGEPVGQLKLGFSPKGVRFDFPQAVDEVSITVNNYAGRILRISTYSGNTLLSQQDEIVFNEVKSFIYNNPNMTAITVEGGDRESSVVEICLCLPDESPKPETPCKKTCINFKHLTRSNVFPNSFVHENVKFSSLGDPIYGSPIGEPINQMKLGFPRQGLRMDFPQVVDKVDLTVNNYAGEEIIFRVFNGSTLVNQFIEIINNQVKTLTINELSITAIEISGGKNEASLVEVCLCLSKPNRPPIG